jgi:hypothetical protein
MKRTTGLDHVANHFSDGDPLTATPSTEVDSDILNVFQEELCSVVEGAGDVLDQAHTYAGGNDTTQLFTAIKKLIASRGAGGVAGATWRGAAGTSPVETEENGEKVWLFEAGGASKLTLFLKVPQSYIAGKQISIYIAEYSPSAANTQLLSSTSYLIRRNTDAVDSVANSRASTNVALVNTVANQYRQATLDVTTADGKINAVAVSAGDLIRVDLSRGADTDAADVRFIPSATEIKFG